MGNTNTNDQIATLTHEGSHHMRSSTGDEKSPINGQTMYGQTSCKAVAQQCAAQGLDSEDCDAARKNADTYCYFINDAAAAQTAAAGTAGGSGFWGNTEATTGTSTTAGPFPGAQ